MSYDYLVIGGGASGMTSALLLAKNGYRVALVEKHPCPGPLLSSFDRQGLRFDTGFHYSGDLDRGQLLDRFFRYLGLSPLIQTSAYDAAGFDVFRSLRPAFEFRFPMGYEALRERLTATFPAEADAIATYLRVIAEIKATTDDFILETGKTKPYLREYDEVSLKDFLDGLTDNTLLQALLCCHGLLYGVAPEQVPLALHARVVGSYYRSVHGIVGGGESLVAAVLTCRGCNATVHPRTLLQLVPEGLFRPVYRRRLAGLKESASGVILYAASDRPIALLDRANLYLAEDPTAFFSPQEGTWQQRPLFVSAARKLARERQAQGFFSIGLTPAELSGDMLFAGDDGGAESYGQAKERVARLLRTRLERLCPELRERVVGHELSTSRTLKRYSHSPAGSLYGVAQRVGQKNPLPLTRIPGLFLAGQAINGPGLLGVMISAFQACAHAIGSEQLKKDLMRCN
ncbi:MAG: FAD-dependent oxidoreductase [Desulfuromonadaceae bacterium]